MTGLRNWWRRRLYRFAGRLPCRLITLRGQPYLERYHLTGLFGCQIYLHRFVRADAERHVHDHPWRWCASLVLAGQYVEELAPYDDPAVGYATYRRLVTLLNWITPRTRHRIIDVDPETWTLFIAGPRFKRWGFYTVEPVPGSDALPLDYAVVYQPHPDNTNHAWHHTAPRGDQTGREPMKEAA